MTTFTRDDLLALGNSHSEMDADEAAHLRLLANGRALRINTLLHDLAAVDSNLKSLRRSARTQPHHLDSPAHRILKAQRLALKDTLVASGVTFRDDTSHVVSRESVDR